jgi:hypothetical protein
MLGLDFSVFFSLFLWKQDLLFFVKKEKKKKKREKGWGKMQGVLYKSFNYLIYFHLISQFIVL